MGELSKKIGEHGEKVVLNFLRCIGWDALSDGESISCYNSITHKRSVNSSNRTTHGIDLFFSYKSNLESFALENVLISVKYTTSAYKNSDFKSHFKDIANTLECFSKSDLKNESNEIYEYKGIKRSNDTAVLFWLTEKLDCDQSVVENISGSNLDESLRYSNIQVIDSARASFIYNSVVFARKIKNNSDVLFHYTFGSSNYIDPEVEKFGKIMPVEYLTAPMLAMRIIDKNNNIQSFCISINEEYSDSSMKYLVNLARDVSQEFSNEFIFLFSKYDPVKNKSSVSAAIRSLGMQSSSIKVDVFSYNDDFRSLVNDKS